MWATRADSRLLAAVLAGLVVLAWAALALWGASPGGYLLRHETLGSAELRFHGYLPAFALFVAGWSLMTVAMMLPTSLPLVLLFSTITRRRSGRWLLILLLLAGYLAVWAGFGAAAHLGDFWLHRLVEASGWLHANAWLLGAVPLLLAGGYQFSSLKYKCLDKCRSPYGFIIEHWRGGDERLQSLKLGLHHGLFCVGCCWSLMLLMFALSLGNLAWMLALAAVMGIEKNLPWGRRISAPVGVVLLSAGATVVALNLSSNV